MKSNAVGRVRSVVFDGVEESCRLLESGSLLGVLGEAVFEELDEREGVYFLDSVEVEMNAVELVGGFGLVVVEPCIILGDELEH